MLNYAHRAPASRTFCGDSSLAQLPHELDRANAERVVVVCNRSLTAHPDAVSRVEAQIGSRLVGRFDRVESRSPLPSVIAAAQLLSECEADAVVVVGGGSAIVTARAASILVAEDKPIDDLCTVRSVDGTFVSPVLAAPKIPQWVVPSTPTIAYAKAGSAIRDPASGRRLALFDPKTRPRALFFDPYIAMTAPIGLVRSASVNAYAAAVEALQAAWDDPLAEASLRHAVLLLTRALPKLSAGDPSTRLQLMSAALLCGQGTDFAAGSLAQLLAHAAGPRSSVPNGVVEALLLPHTMRHAGRSVHGRSGRVAEALDGWPAGTSDGDPTPVAITAVAEFLASVGIPRRLRDIGIVKTDLPSIVSAAADDWVISRLSSPITRDELFQVLDAAW